MSEIFEFVPVSRPSERNFGEVTSLKEVPSLLPEPTPIVIKEASESRLHFNVMPDRPVEEALTIKEYRIGGRYVEAVFDRFYKSTMRKSPDHLIVASVLVQTQKLMYVYFCHYFGLELNLHGPELVKMWPTHFEIDMPKLVRKRKNVIQRVWITNLEAVRTKQYRVTLYVEIERGIRMFIKSAVFHI